MSLRDYEENEIYMSGPDVNLEDIQVVVEMLKNGWYGKRAYEYVEKFESKFAESHNRSYGVMTPNCTSAIHLVLQALNIGPGHEVIVPNSTWIASAAPVIYVGATPVFADVDLDTWCLSAEEVSRLITNKTKAVISVNLYGAMPNYDALQTLCDKNNIFLIEDAAESLGSRYKDKPSGYFGVSSVFSFHRTKTLTTGEGGMILTSDPNLNQRIRILRDHGRSPGEFYNQEVTFKYMPSNLSAALGYAQLKRVNQLIDKKRNIFNFYKNALSEFRSLKMNYETTNSFNSVWNSVINCNPSTGIDILEVQKKLTSKKIPFRPFFYPLTSLPAIQNRNISFNLEDLPNSYILFENSFCLPSALNLTNANLSYITENLRDIFCELGVT